MSIDRFQNEQRIVVTSVISEERSFLLGSTGTVVRLRRADHLAWVNIDHALPAAIKVFPDLDQYGNPEPRANHILLSPEECDVLDPQTAPTVPANSSPEATSGGPLAGGATQTGGGE